MAKALITEILEYLRELKDNNNREWFTANKERYTGLKEKFERLIDELIGRIVVWDPELRGVTAKDCIYRIYRDVRFSPDKTPYKTHFSAYICGFRGRNSGRCGYYFHIEPDNCLFGGGCYCPEPALLKRLRQDIYDNIEEFSAIIHDPEFEKEFPEIGTEGRLKKVPSPFPSDFSEAELLKRRNYDIGSVKSDSFFESKDIIDKADNIFKKMYKLNHFFNYTIDEGN